MPQYCCVGYVKQLDSKNILKTVSDELITENIEIASSLIDEYTDVTFNNPIPTSIKRASALITLWLFEAKPYETTGGSNIKILQSGSSKIEYFGNTDIPRITLPEAIRLLLNPYVVKTRTIIEVV